MQKRCVIIDGTILMPRTNWHFASLGIASRITWHSSIRECNPVLIYRLPIIRHSMLLAYCILSTQLPWIFYPRELFMSWHRELYKSTLAWCCQGTLHCCIDCWQVAWLEPCWCRNALPVLYNRTKPIAKRELMRVRIRWMVRKRY